MKRSGPPKRRTALKRTGGPKRTALRRRTKVKPGWTDAERQAAERWAWEVKKIGRCLSCRQAFPVWLLHAHHLVPKAALTALGLRAYWWDTRNGAPLCDTCHQLHHSWARRLTRQLLGPTRWHKLWTFAREHDIVWLAEQEYPE